MATEMTESATTVYKEYISTLQDQLTSMNTKLDNLQAAVDVCKDSVSTLNTTIAESTNYWALIISPYGVAVIGIIMAVICVIAVKKGISVSKNGTTISIGGDKNEENH